MDRNPVIIGLYGLPGSGKSYILRTLQKNNSDVLFFDGSSEIDQITPGGLAAFKEMREPQKTIIRERAIHSTREKALVESKPAVVSGHALLWSPETSKGTDVFTKADAEVYSRIIYLKTNPDQILQFRERDRGRNRTQETIAIVSQRQQEEHSLLRDLCLQSGILFHTVSSSVADERCTQVATILKVANLDNQRMNEKRVEDRVDNISRKMADEGTVFLIDCDQTLSPADTGASIWEELSKRNDGHRVETLKTIFSSRLGCSPTAFRQAAISYVEALNEDEQLRLEANVLANVEMYPAMLDFVTKLRQSSSHQVIFFTCGLASLWERILDHHQLDDCDVIGAGRGLDGLIVTPQIKADILRRLRTIFPEKHFIAIGDGPTDIEMLKAADEGVVIVGDSDTRSRTMDGLLSAAITEDNCSFKQILMDPSVKPRLNLEVLPLGNLDTLLEDRPRVDLQIARGLRVVDLSETTVSKLLATNMRDAAVSGSALRAAHKEAGYYLAIAELSKLIGLEKKPLRHVLGHQAMGSRLKDEEKTLIVALMRGGEPMAFGVNDALPEARFRHAKEVGDLTLEHLADVKNVVLVDSVINTGKTIIEFARRVHELTSGSKKVRVWILSGVVQDQAVRAGGALLSSVGGF